MKVGLDCVAAPAPDTLAAMVQASGATWLCAYIGGPTALGTGWTADVHRALSPLLADGFLPTYAGVGYGGPFTALRGTLDGQEAANLLARAGFDPDGTPLVLDLESRAYDAGAGNGIDAYCQAWADTVRSEGARAVLYSSVAGCAALASLFDAVWVARWIDSGYGALSMPPEISGAGYWQYASNVTVAGVPCDANVAGDGALFARPTGGMPVADVDQGWLDKKAAVVQAAGELVSVADMMVAEANRKSGPRVTVVRRLAGDVRQRADGILA